jgi:hypothetical protein
MAKFAKGNTFGKGRAPGTKNRRTVCEELLLENEEKTTRSILRHAEAGNGAAISAVAKWIGPDRRWRSQQFALPPPKDAREVREQLGVLISMAAAGEIDLDSLRAYSEASKVLIDSRVEELETLVKGLREREGKSK